MANTNNDKRGNIKTIRPNFMWIWAAVVMIIIGYSFFSGGDSKPVTSDWYTVADMIRNGEVQRIKVMNKNTALVYLTPEAIEKYRESDATGRTAYLHHRFGRHTRPRRQQCHSRIHRPGQPRKA